MEGNHEMRKGHLNSWMIWYAIGLHLTWGVCVLVTPQTAGVTAIYHVSLVFMGNTWATGAALLGVGALAVAGLAVKSKSATIWFLLPQQFVLVLSAVGAIVASIGGHFADGVPRPHAFIFADQTPALLAAVLHTLAFLDIYFSPPPMPPIVVIHSPDSFAKHE